MPCLIAMVLFGMPRLALFSLWLFGEGYLGRAYDSTLIPLLGFFFFPLTTLAYAFVKLSMTPVGGISDGGWVVVGLALLCELGVFGGSYGMRRRRRKPD